MRDAGPTELAKQHVPLYRVIEQDLRERVQSGKWTAGAMLPSRKSLAKEYGVDMRTIQRAISDLLADGTLHAHGGRGTFVPVLDGSGPNGTAKVAVKTVAIIAEQSFNPVASWPAMVHSIHEGLRKHVEDCRVITINTSAKTPEGVVRNEHDALRMVEGEGLAGVIMFHAGGDATLPDIRHVIDAGIPTVFVDRLPFEHGCDFVGIDNRIATREAIEYLMSIGHRRIAIVAPDENVTTIDDRLNGFFDTFMSAGLPAPQDLVFRLALAKSLTREGLMSEIERVNGEIMSMADRPTAIVAINDFLAEYIITALEDKGISVPGDFSVMGFDDVEQFLPRKPRLTTVRQPFETMGERAASLVAWRITHADGQSAAYQHVLLPTRLIIRETTRAI